jgi:hypothetical protein
MKKKGVKVWGLIMVLAMIWSVFGGVVSAGDRKEAMRDE